MNNEALINFCFIQSMGANDSFKKEIMNSLEQLLFNEEKLTWELTSKEKDKLDVINVEINGLCSWRDEEETVHFIENHANASFWEYLQGFQITISKVMKGCGCCGGTT